MIFFGKSKHRQGIPSEYARLATDTGGQAFTDKDTLQGFSSVLERVICDSPSSQISTKKAHHKSNLPLTNPNSQSQTTEEENMQLLTIDTKNNCYVIDPEGMNTLQETVASKLTLEQDNFEIQISDGRYSYDNDEGEPFVLLWIYGTEGSTFINKDTGVETGATWTTLNGYKQKLRLEVKGNQ